MLKYYVRYVCVLSGSLTGVFPWYINAQKQVAVG